MFFKKTRIIKVAAADKGRGVMTPLPHGSGLKNTHRPEQVPFVAFGTRNNAVWPE